MLRINALGGLFVAKDGRVLAGAAAQPRRLAILGLLARAGDRGMTRDKLMALLWPDAEEERGRKALTQALYALRQEFGAEDAVAGVKDLRLNPELVQSDVSEFTWALSSGQFERAVAAYSGPFLDGFHLPGADEFERWVETERSSLSHDFGEALRRLALAAAQAGDLGAAVGWWKRLAAHDPLDSRASLALMKALAAAGDRTGALQHARIHEALLEQHLDLPPDHEVVAYAAQLRAELPRPPAPASMSPNEQPAEPAPVGPSDISQPAGPPIPATTSSPQPIAPTAIAPGHRPAWRTWLPVAGVAGLVILGAVWGIGRRRNAGLSTSPVTDSIPSLAVGWISDYSAGSAAQYSRALSDMLATNLARSPAVRVLSTARVYELIRQLNTGDDSSSGAVLAAARAAGATAVIDGALYELAPGRYRLDLRRVDLVSGDVIDAHQVVGTTLFELADSGTARLLDGLGARALPGGLAEVTTRSLDAYRLYEEGLRLFYAGKKVEAETRFMLSLRADPDFAMAALYAARAVDDTRIGWTERMAQARRASARASERERLIIQAEWAHSNTDPRLRAYAESLVTRYPQELEGHLYLGTAMLLAGEFEAARKPLYDVIAMDSLGLKSSGDTCPGCRAFPGLVYSYEQADSLAAALQVYKLWTRLQPRLARAWSDYGLALARDQRFDEAEQMLAISDSLGPLDERRSFYHAIVRLWEGRVREAEAILRPEARQGSPTHRQQARWYRVIALRNAGRMDEALAEGRRYRASLEAGPRLRASAHPAAVAEAWVLFERGEARASAALFDSIVRYRMPAQDSTYHARHVIWSLSHAAAGYAQLRDTLRLIAIRDTIHQLAPQSLYGRDQVLEHYVNGLIWRLRGNTDSAIAELRRAIYSPTLGYTRVNLVLAEVLLETGDPLGAIAVLAPALRGSFESSNYYVTHQLLHQRLGEAWQRAGDADSASYHREWAAKMGR